MSGPSVATDRAALLLQLVPYLISKGEVSVAEAADEFDVTAEQMRTMVRGLTVIGLPGDSGYWQMANELFDIDWDLLDERDLIVITNSVGLERAPRLTAREAAALLAGLQLAATIPGVGDSQLFAGLLAKLSRGASRTPAAVVVASEPVDAVRRLVADALGRQVAVSFTYKTPEGSPTTRTVDPVKVLIAQGQWYLQGWCHLREAMRTFHLDRVSDLSLTDIPITHEQEAVPGWFADAGEDVIATLEFPASVAPLLGDYLDRATVTTSAGVSTARMRIADEVSLRRLAARRGGEVRVVAPVGAREAARNWAEAALAQYSDAS
ncbi:helix-turn-helix transcriptional regulator [Microbacterium sp. bgisy207]|uniref:helix-turn-helix transcriptional regulator n=1 Tax=Microbacterium sp. bgisy207 TaxID=3413800 RepID=UPI003EBBA987